MMVIGIAGYARCGKDTFVGIAKNILAKNGYFAVRFAFADPLKDEVTKMLVNNGFKASVYTDDSEVKRLIRPLLVWWGCQRRYESQDGLYWVDKIDHAITNHIGKCCAIDTDKFVFLISDVRFPNEAKWVQERFNGDVIHLRRFSMIPFIDTLNASSKEWFLKSGFKQEDEEAPTKIYDNAPNEEEEKQDPLVRKVANQCIEWENKGKLTPKEAIEDLRLQQVVFDALNKSKQFNGKLLL